MQVYTRYSAFTALAPQECESTIASPLDRLLSLYDPTVIQSLRNSSNASLDPIFGLYGFGTAGMREHNCIASPPPPFPV